MTLKDIIKLIPANETISIYDASTNIYICFEIHKEEYGGEYDDCAVAHIGSNLTGGYCSVLEVEILTQ